MWPISQLARRGNETSQSQCRVQIGNQAQEGSGGILTRCPNQLLARAVSTVVKRQCKGRPLNPTGDLRQLRQLRQPKFAEKGQCQVHQFRSGWPSANAGCSDLSQLGQLGG